MRCVGGCWVGGQAEAKAASGRRRVLLLLRDFPYRHCRGLEARLLHRTGYARGCHTPGDPLPRVWWNGGAGGAQHLRLVLVGVCGGPEGSVTAAAETSDEEEEKEGK